MGLSYDQKTEKVNDKKSNDYFNVNIQFLPLSTAFSTGFSTYAHIKVVVAFLVVNFFSFLVITQSHELGFTRN